MLYGTSITKVTSQTKNRRTHNNLIMTTDVYCIMHFTHAFVANNGANQRAHMHRQHARTHTQTHAIHVTINLSASLHKSFRSYTYMM